MIKPKFFLKDINTLIYAIEEFGRIDVDQCLHFIDIISSIGQNKKYFNLFNIYDFSTNIAISLNNEKFINSLYNVYTISSRNPNVVLKESIFYGMLLYNNFNLHGIKIILSNPIFIKYQRQIKFDLSSKKYFLLKHNRITCNDKQ